MRGIRISALLIALAGAVFLAKGFWIPAKAWLAKDLMDRAFARTSITTKAQKPWPSADFGVIAKLRIGPETIHVLDRATNQAMAFGAGRHEEYDSENGPLVLSGHRDTHFATLEHIAVGDTVSYLTAESVQHYIIGETRIYDIREGVIYPPGSGEILLITCWPFDAVDPGTTKRYLVWGEAKSTRDKANAPSSHQPAR